MDVMQIGRASSKSGITLTWAPCRPLPKPRLLARADGYLKARSADIGDKVHAGQTLAEIDAPELDQQIRQAQAAIDQAQAGIDQAQAAVEQSQANLTQGKTNLAYWRASPPIAIRR